MLFSFLFWNGPEAVAQAREEWGFILFKKSQVDKIEGQGDFQKDNGGRVREKLEGESKGRD